MELDDSGIFSGFYLGGSPSPSPGTGGITSTIQKNFNFTVEINGIETSYFGKIERTDSNCCIGFGPDNISLIVRADSIVQCFIDGYG